MRYLGWIATVLLIGAAGGCAASGASTPSAAGPEPATTEPLTTPAHSDQVPPAHLAPTSGAPTTLRECVKSGSSTAIGDGAVEAPFVPNNVPAEVHGFDRFVLDYQVGARDQARAAIVLIDSGIQADHPSFGDRVTRFVSLPDLSADPIDRGTHGTWSASIAAATEQTVPDARAVMGPDWPQEPLTWTGMIPNAEIWVVAVDTASLFDAQTGNYDWPGLHRMYREALDQTLTWHAESPDLTIAVSMINTFPTDMATSHLQEKLAAMQNAGISVVSPAGNGAQGSLDPRAAFTLDPAVDPTVIGAGALDAIGPASSAEGGLAIAQWASRGTEEHPAPDLAVLVGAMPAVTSASDFGPAGGTSAASPTIAAAALYLQVLTQREYEAGRVSIDAATLVRSGELIEILKTTASTELITEPFPHTYLDSGALDLPAAARELLNRYAACHN